MNNLRPLEVREPLITCPHAFEYLAIIRESWEQRRYVQVCNFCLYVAKVQIKFQYCKCFYEKITQNVIVPS